MKATADVGGLRVQYELLGDEGSPVVSLCHSLGTNRGLWDAQVAALSRAFRVLRYDLRGHGETDVGRGPYTIELLAADFLGLLDALGIERAHFCGVSLGGFIGQWLGARAPERIDRLVLSNTAARVGPPAGWDDRIALIRRDGMRAIESATIGRWFTPAFVAREPAIIDAFRQMVLASPVEGYAASCAAIRDMDLRPLAPSISRPTLVISGAHDRVTPTTEAAWLVGRIPRADLLTLPAAHLANVEAASEYTAAVLAFLSNAGE